MSDKRTYYFGCIGAKGHYMFPAVSRKDFPGANYKIIDYIDGLYTPGGDYDQGEAQFSMIGPFTIIAWHDYTIDKRPGSNSNIIGFGFTGTRAEIIVEMFKDFHLRYPQVIARQTAPINIADYGAIYTPTILPHNQNKNQ
jgi:hypothetical protein